MNFNTANNMFKTYLQGRSYSKATVNRYVREVNDFFTFIDSCEKNDVRDIDGNDILSYRKFIFNAKNKEKKPRYCQSTQAGYFTTLSTFFRFLTKNEHIISNPRTPLDLKIQRRYKERKSLSVKDMNALLDIIDGDDMLDMRDRTLFELMYGTGLRVSEVSDLNLTDIDLNIGKLFVKHGKGNMERIVPLGASVIESLKIYLSKCRPQFLKKALSKEATGRCHPAKDRMSVSREATGRCHPAKDRMSVSREALFLTLRGNRIGINTIARSLKTRLTHIGKETEGLSPHNIRHTFATHMLEGGASIKHVKEIMGHKSIQTTMIYTHFSVKSLKRIMKKYHPRENALYEELTLTDDFIKNLTIKLLD